MWLEDFSQNYESNEWVWNAEASVEVFFEKLKESTKKYQAKTQKTQKDEKKAKKYDILLAWFLVKIIVDKKYDFILEKLFNTIKIWFSSNFILWILSLININISNKIREISNKEKINFSYKPDSIITFQDNDIHFEIQKRINLWVEDIIDAVSIEYSHIQTQNIIILLEKQSKEIIEYSKEILIFFLKDINIIIKDSQANDIVIFILNEVSKVLKKLEIEEI